MIAYNNSPCQSDLANMTHDNSPHEKLIIIKGQIDDNMIFKSFENPDSILYLGIYGFYETAVKQRVKKRMPASNSSVSQSNISC